MIPAIIAALPREVKALVKGWDGASCRGRSGCVHERVGCGGVCGNGCGTGAVAVEAAMAAGPVTALVSVGLAGACDPALRVGDLVRAGVVIDARTGERFADGRVSSRCW